MKKTTWIAAALVLALAAGGAWWWSQRSAQAAVQYRTALIERGPLQASVSASGTVNPVTQVSVGTQVSGQVRAVHVDFNTEVKAGQLIAEIDPQTFEYRVSSAQADVNAARAAVAIAVANAASSRANVSRAQSDLAEAQRTHERNLSLVAQGFIAQSEADRTRAVLTSAQESLKAVQALVGVSSAQIQSAQANVAQREAALAQARIDLSRTRITSPVNGIVIKRTVEKGQTVAASLQAPELFVIAQNLSDMQVDASIDEADVGRIRPGQKASFTVDAFPGQNFEGEVRQVRKAATNVSNVVTYVAVVGFANTSGRLLPGMTANVRVVTESRESVLKVPNAALRWNPSREQVMEKFRHDLFKRHQAGKPKKKDTSARGMLWVPEGGLVKPLPVQIGVTDGSQTEVQGEGLTESLPVVVGVKGKETSKSSPGGSPFAPQILKGKGH